MYIRTKHNRPDKTDPGARSCGRSAVRDILSENLLFGAGQKYINPESRSTDQKEQNSPDVD